MSAYSLLLAAHLVAAVFLIGPLAVAGLSSPKAARAGDAGALRAAHRTTRSGGRASLLVVVLGLAMLGRGELGEQWELSQPWVWGSLLLWFVAVAAGEAVVVPAQTRALEAIEGGADGSPHAGRMVVGAGVAALAWVAIVALMVLKPL